MQLILATISLSLPLLAAAAGTCSSSGSLSWPPVGDCATPSKFNTLTESCRACCLNDANCFQTCLKAGGINVRDVSGIGFIGEKRDLTSRAIALNCGTNENCYKYTDGSLLCLNLGTGAYHDDVGGNGSYFSGVYTAPDGKVQTGTSAATSTDGSKSKTSGSAAASVRATPTGTAAGVSSAGTVTNTAAATSTAAAPAISQVSGPVLRLVGLIAGLVL